MGDDYPRRVWRGNTLGSSVRFGCKQESTMLKHSPVHWCLLAVVTFGICAAAAADAEPASIPPTLTVEISNLQSDKGQVGCSLYSKQDGFPSKPGKADVTVFVQPKARKAVCVFKGLKPGKYAVSVMHDENKDGKLETSMVGRPKEPWGVSNNVPPERFGPPKFEAALFSYAGGAQTLRVNLRL